MKTVYRVFLICVLFSVAVSAFVEPNSVGQPFLVFQEVEKKPDQPEAYDVNYAYDPGGRRDPFVSLLGGIKGQNKNIPKGALTVQDVRVVGITKSPTGYVAILMGADKKARFMKVGDKLYDGEIISIEAQRVLFRQDIDDPSSPIRSKEVEKRLHPVQEGT